MSTSSVNVVAHPLVQHKLSLMREKDRSTKSFREILNEIGMLLGYEVTRDLPLAEVVIETPLAQMHSAKIAGKKLVFVPVLRAGVTFVDGMMDLVPTARVAHIGLYREPQTFSAVEYFFKSPSDLSERLAIVVTPVVATANTAVAAIDRLKERGAKDIRLVCMISRRHFLSAGAGAATMLAWNPRLARAQSGQVVVGTWGGDYGQLLSDLVDKPILAPKGIEVLQDVANAEPRKTKLLAERQSRRGSMDVACLSDADHYIVEGTDAFEAIDPARISRLDKVFPELRTKTAIPHIYSAQVILYNVNQVKTPPTSWADLWDPKWRGRVGLVDILFPNNTIMTAATSFGGFPISAIPTSKGRNRSTRTQTGFC